MKPTSLKELLRKTVPAKLPVLIKGAPGIGKSDIVRQVGEEIEADVLVSHPVIDDPTDYKGLPAIVEDGARFLPFGNLKKLINAQSRTIAFIDDMGQAPKVVQAAVMQLVLARTVNEKKISDEVVFIAATNDRHHKAGVTGVLAPLKSRFASIVQLEVDVDDWCKWAFNNDIPGEVIAFIRFRPELLMDTEKPTNEIVNTHSPRTVANAGMLFRNGIDDYESLEGAAGSAFATEFTGFLEVWQELPSIDSILTTPQQAPVPEKPASRYAISTALVQRISNNNAERVMQYAERMPEEFTVLVLRDSLNKEPSLAHNKTFVKWGTENSDIFE